MPHDLFVPLGPDQLIPEAEPISSAALGAEFLGWEFFSNFESRHEQVQFDHVRWAGGIPVEEGINIDNSPDGSRELVFDLTFENIVDWDREISNGYSNDPVPREGIREMLEFAVENNASFAMIAPTMRYIETAFEDHDAGVEQARADIRDFAVRLLGGEFGALPKEFVLEIGSEYYALPIWRDNFQNPDLDIARIAGDVFAAMVAELDEVLQDPELNPTGYDINIAVQLGRSLSRDDNPSLGFDRNGDINGGWGEHADNLDFIDALRDAGALDAVDSLIWHRYVPNFWGIERGLWEPANGGLTLSSVIDDWEQAAGRDLGLVGGHLSPAAQGDEDIEFNAPGLTNILQLTTGLLAEGMDHGTIFGLGFKTDGSLGFRSSLVLGGQLYSLMVESLPGMKILDGFQNNTSPVETVWENGSVVDEFLRVDDSINTYVFENEDLIVIFLVAKDFEEETLDYTLHFDETFENVDITRLRDTAEQLFNPTTGDLIGHFGTISHEHGLPLEATNTGSSLDVTFRQDFEVIRVTLDRELVDVLVGTDGDDLFRINHEDDAILEGGEGRDTVQSTVTFSLRDAGNGRDLEDLRFVGTDDLIGLGNSLDNSILGNAGNNHLSGVWGNDTVNGEGGDDTLVGEVGHDQLFGGKGADRLEGGAGNDILNGGDHADLLFGGEGNDVLIGGDGHDTLYGGSGSDRFIIDPASRSGDTLKDFTLGEDLIDLSETPADSFEDLLILWTNGRVFIQDDYGTFLFLEGLLKSNIEQFAATDFVFRGANEIRPFPNAIASEPGKLVSDGGDASAPQGGTGHDLLRGDVDDNLLEGLGGFDTLNGGTGNDTLEGNSGSDVLNGGDGDDELQGGQGADLLRGDAGNDLLVGRNGFDTLEGGTGQDTLQGNAGSDSLSGGEDDDLLIGGIASDTLEGGAGNDMLQGGNGFDLLNGGDGDDLLEGNAGSDTLDGGAGNDVLRGGLGADTFVFRAGSGNDRVVDFGNVDALELEAALLGGGSPDPADLIPFATRDADGFLLLDFGGGDTLTFTGITNTGAILDDVSFV